MNQTCCSHETATTFPVATPRYQTRETEQAYVVTAEVPGAERSSIETTLDGDSLTVTARRVWTTPEGWNTLHLESTDADYRLVFDLDHRVNREGVKAELTQGVLTLTIPKTEAVKPRRIEIGG